MLESWEQFKIARLRVLHGCENCTGPSANILQGFRQIFFPSQSHHVTCCSCSCFDPVVPDSPPEVLHCTSLIAGPQCSKAFNAIPSYGLLPAFLFREHLRRHCRETIPFHEPSTSFIGQSMSHFVETDLKFQNSEQVQKPTCAFSLGSEY